MCSFRPPLYQYIAFRPLHLCLEIGMQLFQRVHICRCGRPPDSKSLGRVRLRYHVEMHMVDLLMCQSAVIL